MARRKPTLRARPAIYLLIGLYVASHLFSNAASSFIDENTPATLFYLLLMIQETLFYGLPAYIYIREARGIHLPALTLARPLNVRQILYVSLAAVLHQAAMQLLTGTFGSWLHSNGLSAALTTPPMPQTTWDIILVIPALALVPALCEETLFRGALFPSMQREFSDGKSIVLTALLFALMHGNLLALPSHFFAGLVMTLLAFQTGGLTAPMVYHFIYNTVSYLSDAILWMQPLRGAVLQSPSLCAALMSLLLLLSLFVLKPLFMPIKPYVKRQPSRLTVAAVAVVAIFFLAAYLPALFPV